MSAIPVKCIIQCNVIPTLLNLMRDEYNPPIQFNAIWIINNILSHHEYVFLSITYCKYVGCAQMRVWNWLELSSQLLNF